VNSVFKILDMKDVEMLHEKGVSNIGSQSFHLVFDSVCFHQRTWRLHVSRKSEDFDTFVGC
jgi:hypothetical protein